MPKIKVPMEKRRLYTPFRVAQMIQNAPSLKDKSIIALYYIFGVREKEPLFMTKEDIWFDDEWLYVRVRREKPSKKRVLPQIDVLKVNINTRFVEYILRYWRGAKDGERIWFYAENLETARNYVWKMIKELDPDGWVQLFRHSRKAYFRKKGYSDKHLMAWFGWDDPRTPMAR